MRKLNIRNMKVEKMNGEKKVAVLLSFTEKNSTHDNVKLGWGVGYLLVHKSCVGYDVDLNLKMIVPDKIKKLIIDSIKLNKSSYTPLVEALTEAMYNTNKRQGKLNDDFVFLDGIENYMLYRCYETEDAKKCTMHSTNMDAAVLFEFFNDLENEDKLLPKLSDLLNEKIAELHRVKNEAMEGQKMLIRLLNRETKKNK